MAKVAAVLVKAEVAGGCVLARRDRADCRASMCQRVADVGDIGAGVREWAAI